MKVAKVAKSSKVVISSSLVKSKFQENCKGPIGVYCPCNKRWNFCIDCRPIPAIAHKNRTIVNSIIKKNVDKGDLHIIRDVFNEVLNQHSLLHLRHKDLSPEQWKYIYPKVNIILKKILTDYSAMRFNHHNVYGCDYRFFIFNISRQLKSGWKIHKNRKGIWDIDHKIPCASFDLTKEKFRKQCFYFTNYKPMDSKENKQKSDKIIS